VNRAQRIALAFGVVIVTTVVFCVVLGTCYPVIAASYPRVASYASMRSSGDPVIRQDGTLDSLRLRRLARHPVVSLNVVPMVPHRPDIVTTLRHFNPTVRVYGYILAGDFWLGPDAYVAPGDQSFYADWWRAMKATDGWLYLLDGTVKPVYGVDWSRAAVADTLTDLIVRVLQYGILNGVFLDVFSSDIAWASLGTNPQADFRRAGWTSLAQMDSARAANMLRCVARIRAECDPWLVVIGNGTSRAEVTAACDGWMREGFDNGLTTYAQARAWLAADPSEHHWLKAEGGYGNPYTADAMRRARFALGTATLYGAMASFSTDRDLYPPLYHDWWFDEYAVTPMPFAYADTTGTHVGYLGAWLKPPARLANGVERGDFANGGCVLCNPTDSVTTTDLIYPLWQRIKGVRDPVVNNGRSERFQRIGPRDCVFLLRKPVPTRERP
jgi:hypothetical protein